MGYTSRLCVAAFLSVSCWPAFAAPCNDADCKTDFYKIVRIDKSQTFQGKAFPFDAQLIFPLNNGNAAVSTNAWITVKLNYRAVSAGGTLMLRVSGLCENELPLPTQSSNPRESANSVEFKFFCQAALGQLRPETILIHGSVQRNGPVSGQVVFMTIKVHMVNQVMTEHVP